jgi:hypothetical protein
MYAGAQAATIVESRTIASAQSVLICAHRLVVIQE